MTSGRIITFSFIILSGCFASDSKSSLKIFIIDHPDELKEFFSYTPDRIPFICAHRGGSRETFPENCIATFENTLSKVHAMIEVDPRYTKDSVIVLMHDPILDRTTSGTGRVSDYTYEELKALRLKDTEGNITGHRIPTLDETLEWAKGKTILVLDRKDVPIADRIKKIEEHNAVTNAIVIAYSTDEIKECYNLNSDIIMEVMLPDTVQLKKLDETGVPWANMVGFVSHNLVEDTEIFDLVHRKGSMCIVGSSRNHDISFKKGDIKSVKELADKYRKMVNDGADIIEADLAVEAGLSIRDTESLSISGSKSKFFSY